MDKQALQQLVCTDDNEYIVDVEEIHDTRYFIVTETIGCPHCGTPPRYAMSDVRTELSAADRRKHIESYDVHRDEALDDLYNLADVARRFQ